MAIFLTVFFILFVSELTKKAFENEIGHLIDSNLGKYIDKLEESEKEKMGLYLRLLPIDNMINKLKEPSEYVREHNKWIRMIAIGVAIVGIMGLIGSMYLLYNSCGQCVPLMDIIKENIIVFVFVGIAEYLFFVNIAFKFVPAPPSLLVNSLINKFKKSLVENAS